MMYDKNNITKNYRVGLFALCIFNYWDNHCNNCNAFVGE